MRRTPTSAGRISSSRPRRAASWIREFGIFAEPLEEGGQPVLFAYGNHAPFYKAKSVLGQATTHELSVPVIMSGTAEVQIIVSESGYASRLELLQIAGVVEDLRHPREAVWTLDEAVEDGGTLTLPEGVAYLPGEHLLDVFGMAWPAIRASNTKRFFG